MATRNLNVTITGDAKGIGVATRQTEGHFRVIQRSAKITGAAVKASFGLAAAGTLVGVSALKKSVDAAKDAEKSQARLKAQLKSSGASYQAHAKEIDAVIQKHSQLAGIDDEDLQDAFTSLVRSTGSVNKSMKDLGLVTDIARAKNIDVTKAADLLGKVHAGNTSILKRYGIEFEPVTKAQDKLKDSKKKATDEEIKAAKAADKTATSQKAIAELQKRFGGQAEAYGKTAAGAQERFGVAVENVEEKIGAKLLPVLTKVVGGVATFVAQMDSGKGAGGRFAAAISDAFGKAKQIVGSVITAISKYLSDNREDIQSLGRAFKNVGTAIKTVFTDVIVPAVKLVLPQIKAFVEGTVQTIRGLIRIVSGVLTGDWGKAWDGIKDVVIGRFKQIKAYVEGSAKLFLAAGKAVGKAIGNGILDALGALGHMLLDKVTAAWQWVKDHIKLPSIKLPFGLGSIGDAVGKAKNALPAFGGSLMGARPEMAPFAGAASRFGLHVTSGRRPGAITSSGNVSYHSTGEAIDVAGSSSGMLGFFRQMKNTAGSRLAELIYTPGGVGIKDGHPYRYSGQVARDHFDHVHVAYDSGVPGVGDGPGRDDPIATGSRATGYRGFYLWAKKQHLQRKMGTGQWFNALAAYARSIGADPKQVQHDHGNMNHPGNWREKWMRGATGDGLGKFVATAYGPPWGGIQGKGITATNVNLKGSPHIYGVAVDPRVIPLGTKLKISPNPFGYSGAFTAFDTGGAIKGKRIDFYDWRGRKSQLGWGSRSVTVETVGGGGSSKGGSKAKGGGGTVTVKPSGPGYEKEQDTGSGLTDEQEAALAFTNARRGPAKGTNARAPQKGLTPEQQDAIAANADQTDPNQPLIDALKELAEIEKQKVDLETQVQANQLKIIALANQGPQILGAVIAAVNGGIGGQVGLGLQTPGYAGAVANYGGSAGRL